MSQPAEILARIPQKLLKNGWVRLSTAQAGESQAGLQSGAAFHAAGERGGVQEHGALEGSSAARSWDQELAGGRVQGGVVELSIGGGVALGTSLALAACRWAQEQSRARCGQNVWCAFVDPQGSLYAPGVAAAGIDLSRLLVLHPDESNLSRVALRLAEARIFPVVVIDTVGVPGAHVDISLARWVQVVRRLERMLAPCDTVILLTDQRLPRPLPLPVSKRYELMRSTGNSLRVQLVRDAKEKRLYSREYSVQELIKRQARVA